MTIVDMLSQTPGFSLHRADDASHFTSIPHWTTVYNNHANGLRKLIPSHVSEKGHFTLYCTFLNMCKAFGIVHSSLKALKQCPELTTTSSTPYTAPPLQLKNTNLPNSFF